MIRVAASGLVVAVLLAAAGCSQDDDSRAGSEPATATVTESVTATVTETVTAPADSGSPDLPPASELAGFVEAIASRDLGKLEAAAALTRAGSLADDYVGYVAASATAALDAGSPTTFAVQVSEIADGFAACFPEVPDKACLEVTDFTAEDGLLTGMTVDGSKLQGTLVAGDSSKLAAGSLGEVEFLFGRESADTVWVVVEVTSGSEPVLVDGAGATYRTETGERVSPLETGVVGPTELSPDATAKVALQFPALQLGGRVTLPLSSAGGGATDTVSFRAR